MLDAGETADLMPSVEIGDIQGSLLQPEDRTLNMRELVRALAAECKEEGGRTD